MRSLARRDLAWRVSPLRVLSGSVRPRRVLPGRPRLLRVLPRRELSGAIVQWAGLRLTARLELPIRVLALRMRSGIEREMPVRRWRPVRIAALRVRLLRPLLAPVGHPFARPARACP